jgi:alkylation response protein AidB-like acyl-CoA dehydrogenase
MSLGAREAESPTAATADPSALVRQAQALIPSLRERAERIAQTRMLPEDVVRDLHNAGLMGLLRPRRYGGPEHGFDLVHRVARELGKGDGSTSWVYVVLNAHDIFMPLFPRAVQDAYWASSRASGASSYAPTGKATPTSGGFQLSGKWSFCSGVDHAGWILLGAIVGMLEEPKRPDLRYFLVPEKGFKIVDDWHVMGLRGTGSKSVVLDQCFVPQERILTFGQIVSGRAADASQSAYSESVWVHIGFSFAAPATGIAQTAYEVTVQDLRRRYERRDPVFEAKKPAVQTHLAEASALIDASDLLVTRSLEATFARIASGVRLTNDERARNRRDSCYSIRVAREAAEILMGLTGGHGIAESHPVQRAMRDLYAISAHPATGWDSPALSFGAVALGGAPTEMMI